MMKSRAKTTIFITALALLATTALCQVKNGCVAKKCVECAQSTVVGAARNRYCTKCMDSVLKINVLFSDQTCDGTTTGIDDCKLTHANAANQVVCFQCNPGFSLKVASDGSTTCVKSNYNCRKGRFEGAAELCEECNNDHKFAIHQQCKTSNTDISACGNELIWGFKCDPKTDGSEIDNCVAKTTDIDNSLPISEAQEFSELCALCKEDHSVSGDSTSCIKVQDDLSNKMCVHDTVFTNLCFQCDWFHSYFAVGTHGPATNAQTNKQSGGIMVCEFGKIFSVWVAGFLVTIWLTLV